MKPDSPHYGMVVTDGVAGRVFMLVCNLDFDVWTALAIYPTRCVPARVLITHGQWAVVEE